LDQIRDYDVAARTFSAKFISQDSQPASITKLRLILPFLIPTRSTRSDLSVATMSESRMRVPDKVKEVAKEDFDQAKQLASDAIRSAAYLYPFKVSYTTLSIIQKLEAARRSCCSNMCIAKDCLALFLTRETIHACVHPLLRDYTRASSLYVELGLTLSRESRTSSLTARYGSRSPQSWSRPSLSAWVSPC
jgi:hypothetical protein